MKANKTDGDWEKEREEVAYMRRLSWKLHKGWQELSWRQAGARAMHNAPVCTTWTAVGALDMDMCCCWLGPRFRPGLLHQALAKSQPGP